MVALAGCVTGQRVAAALGTKRGVTAQLNYAACVPDMQRGMTTAAAHALGWFLDKHVNAQLCSTNFSRGHRTCRRQDEICSFPFELSLTVDLLAFKCRLPQLANGRTIRRQQACYE